MSGAGGTPTVALVTGAGRGIGRATALRLAVAGFDVALGALEVEELEAVAGEVRTLGRRALPFALDVADEEQATAFVVAAEEALGPATVLVNNAGTIDLPDDLTSTTPAGWDRTFAVNVRGAFLLCRAVVPGMVERGAGRVINVASTAGLRGLNRRLAYTASKHALVGFTRALAEELRTGRVTVNAVCPGAVSTQLALEARPDADRSGWLDPDQVAGTIAYLAGPDAAHVHGAIVELGDRSNDSQPVPHAARDREESA